jgi:hypothetical protein
MKKYWFLALMSSICLEGLGRRYIPAVPGMAFLVLKDVLLVAGFLVFKPPAAVTRVSKHLYRGFTVAWMGTLLWAFIEMFNPEQPSLILATVGLRALSLWWLAPPLIATLLQNADQRRRAIYVLAIMTIGISVLAALQFLSPPDSAINVYTVVEGEERHASDVGSVVSATGRARVASTFAFLSGFCDFTILVPALLLSFGLETSDKRLRVVSLIATVACAATLPMSGSRGSVLLGVLVLVITGWSTGFFTTAAGRRVLIGGVVGIIAAVAAFPDAFLGVQSRFAASEETAERLKSLTSILPPVALATFDYPLAGAGTGITQNAAVTLHVYTKWIGEIEMQRLLIELGPAGFLLAWAARLGLLVAFVRAASILKRAGRRAVAGAALSYGAVTFFGNLVYDHVWQSLYFVGAGFILAETKAALDTMRAAAERKRAAAVGPPPVSARA